MVPAPQTQHERKGERHLCAVDKSVKKGMRKRGESGQTKGLKMTEGESQLCTSKIVKKGPRKLIIRGPKKGPEVMELIPLECDSNMGQPFDTTQVEREDERQLCITNKSVTKGPRKRRERSSTKEFEVTESMHPKYNDLGQPCGTTQGEIEGETRLSITSKNVEKCPTKRRGRGPAKEFEVTEPMHLEYDNLGQPCGRWRGKYGKQIGLCVRKLSILYSWSEVPESLKNEFWDDTMKLFHIEPDQAKKSIFLSAVAERFRDFKSKLVSGWITLKRNRSQPKKMKENENKEGTEQESGDGMENEEEESGKETENDKGKEKAVDRNQAPALMPYEIWPHITQEEWEAFVAQKSTPKEVEKRRKASLNANKKQHFHHLGPKTYEQKRKEWVDSGFYPNLNALSSATSSSTNTAVNIDRVLDWWCSLHGRDENGERTISDPKTREIADAVIGWKQKEVAGEFTPRANMDALYMVLGKDHNGRVKGQGGVRLGLKKVFGKEYLVTKSKSSIIEPQDMEAIKSAIREELREEMKENFTAILQHMGLPGLQQLHQGTVVPGNRSHQELSAPNDVDLSVPNDIPDPQIPIQEVTVKHHSKPDSLPPIQHTYARRKKGGNN